jgi:hypothetical protein
MGNYKGSRRDLKLTVTYLLEKLAENPDLFQAQRELWLSICRYYQAYDGQVSEKQRWVLENAENDVKNYIDPLRNSPALPF